MRIALTALFTLVTFCMSSCASSQSPTTSRDDLGLSTRQILLSANETIEVELWKSVDLLCSSVDHAHQRSNDNLNDDSAKAAFLASNIKDEFVAFYTNVLLISWNKKLLDNDDATLGGSYYRRTLVLQGTTLDGYSPHCSEMARSFFSENAVSIVLNMLVHLRENPDETPSGYTRKFCFQTIESLAGL